MRTIAVYGKHVSTDFLPALRQMLAALRVRGLSLVCEEKFAEYLAETVGGIRMFSGVFHHADFASIGAELLLSIGGDGTFLDSALYVGGSGVPILGLNAGRLGFLANLSASDMEEAVDYIYKRKYTIGERSMLRVDCPELSTDFPVVLNEVAVQKTDFSSLLNIHTYVDEQYLTTYWADGLIVATPTGSTAYSLSGGGPIVSPECGVVILTPVCPHNLSMRSLVLPDTKKIQIVAESRSDDFVLSLDSRSYRMKSTMPVTITANSFKLQVVNLPGHEYFGTLRTKLGWGEDIRNK